jgi:hypothetical protein
MVESSKKVVSTGDSIGIVTGNAIIGSFSMI